MKPASGFSLIELMIAVAILAILVGIAVPSYTSVITINRFSSEINALIGDLQYARSEGLRQGLPVVICASSDSTTAAPTCSGSNNWQDGWIIFTDVDASATFSAGDILLRAQQPLAVASGRADTLVASDSVGLLSFNREGFPGLKNPLTVTLSNAAAGARFTRCAEVSIVGHVVLENPGTGSCS